MATLTSIEPARLRAVHSPCDSDWVALLGGLGLDLATPTANGVTGGMSAGGIAGAIALGLVSTIAGKVLCSSASTPLVFSLDC